MNELSVKKVDIETGENEGIVVGANNGVIINGMSYTDIRNLCFRNRLKNPLCKWILLKLKNLI